MEAVGVEQVLALVVALDPALGAAHALASDAPQQALTLVAVGGRGGRPDFKVVWCGAGDWVDEGLQGLFVHVALLPRWKTRRRDEWSMEIGLHLYRAFLTSGNSKGCTIIV